MANEDIELYLLQVKYIFIHDQPFQNKIYLIDGLEFGLSEKLISSLEYIRTGAGNVTGKTFRKYLH